MFPDSNPVPFHPSAFWLAMYASALSRWASSELNSWSSPSSLLFRV